jgi:hypothetical protein
MAILLPLPCIMAVTASLIVAKALDQHITREPPVKNHVAIDRGPDLPQH